MKRFVSVGILLVFFFPLSVSAQFVPQVPTIDGDPSDIAWQEAEVHYIGLINEENIEFKILYTSEIIYYLAGIPHNGPNDEVQLDTNLPHDYFGISFDRNGDGTIHGTQEEPDGPDDMIIVNYFEPGGEDLFTKNFVVTRDEDNNGDDNTEGAVQEQNGTLYFEFSKEMNSGDTNGYDINLSDGDRYTLLFAFWDNRPTRDANVIINKPMGNSLFIPFVVNITENNTELYYGIAILSLAVTAVYLFNRFIL